MENETEKIILCRACGRGGSGFFMKKGEYILRRCFSCQSVFVSNLPQNLSSIYSKQYFWGADSGFGYVDYDKDKEPMKKVFNKCLENLENLSGKGKLLDVGAATGYFMNLAKGRRWQVFGVEISDEGAEAGRKKGLDIKTGTIADLPREDEFDAITMFDVIEHFSNPSADLIKAKQLLKKGGVLAIITPDSGSFYARLLGKHWHLIVPPEHITLFNRKSLADLLKETGFEILEIKTPGKSFTIEYILHTLLRWQKLGFWNWLLKIVQKYPTLAEFRLPINLGDNMMVLAKKTR